MKLIITNQWAAPTTPHVSIFVWPRVSRSMFAVRAPRRSERLVSGWPRRTTANICRTARTTRTTATAVIASDTTPAMICATPIRTPLS